MTERATGGGPASGPRPVDGVLLDIDDTLVDTRAAFAAALSAVAAVHLPHVPAERHPELLATWRADAGGHYARYTRGEVAYDDQRRARANELHALHGGPELDVEAYTEWNRLFDAAFRDAWAPHDDAAEAVDALIAAGVAVGCLSNAAIAYQTAKLEAVGLADRVPLLVGVDTFGVGKPDPRVFLEAARRLGTDPARTAYVGDELDVDAVAAGATGMLGVWLDRPGLRDPAADVRAAAAAAGVVTIRSLHELPAALGLGSTTVSGGADA